MKDLLTALTAAIPAGLSYLTWCGVIENELLAPEELAFPFVGLIDDGTRFESRPGKHDIEILNVGVVGFQSIALDDPGASIMGSAAQLGDAGKGVIDIAIALRTLLNDNFLDQSKINFAHCERMRPSQSVTRSGDPWMTFKRLDFSYRRYV